MGQKLHKPERRTDRNSIGPVISRLRRAENLTQEDLAGRAAACGWLISRDAVKRIERGEREVTDIEIRLLAKALRVPPAVLFQ
jgi:transcriptional regulator with XRE-family HTH domain